MSPSESQSTQTAPQRPKRQALTIAMLDHAGQNCAGPPPTYVAMRFFLSATRCLIATHLRGFLFNPRCVSVQDWQATWIAVV